MRWLNSITDSMDMSLSKQIFVGKAMSLLFNTLSRIAIAFLPRTKCLLISWLQSPSAVIVEPKKKKKVRNGDMLGGKRETLDRMASLQM